LCKKILTHGRLGSILSPVNRNETKTEMTASEMNAALAILKNEGEEIQAARAGSTPATLIVVCHYRTFIVRKSLPIGPGAKFWNLGGFFFEIIK